MSRQVRDTILIDGKAYWPERLLRRNPKIERPPVFWEGSQCTACWDGFVHIYHVDSEGRLYLHWVVVVPNQKTSPPDWVDRQPEVVPSEVVEAVYNSEFYLRPFETNEFVYGYRVSPPVPIEVADDRLLAHAGGRTFVQIVKDPENRLTVEPMSLTWDEFWDRHIDPTGCRDDLYAATSW